MLFSLTLQINMWTLFGVLTAKMGAIVLERVAEENKHISIYLQRIDEICTALLWILQICFARPTLLCLWLARVWGFRTTEKRLKRSVCLLGKLQPINRRIIISTLLWVKRGEHSQRKQPIRGWVVQVLQENQPDLENVHTHLLCVCVCCNLGAVIPLNISNTIKLNATLLLQSQHTCTKNKH